MELENFKILFGKKIRSLRKREGMNSEEFAEECKIGKATIERIEQGKFLPRIDTCLMIANFLNITLSELFQD